MLTSIVNILQKHNERNDSFLCLKWLDDIVPYCILADFVMSANIVSLSIESK